MDEGPTSLRGIFRTRSFLLIGGVFCGACFTGLCEALRAGVAPCFTRLAGLCGRVGSLFCGACRAGRLLVLRFFSGIFLVLRGLFKRDFFHRVCWNYHPHRPDRPDCEVVASSNETLRLSALPPAVCLRFLSGLLPPRQWPGIPSPRKRNGRTAETQAGGSTQEQDNAGQQHATEQDGPLPRGSAPMTNTQNHPCHSCP